MKFKKLLAIGMSLTLSAGLLAGCGGSSSEESDVIKIGGIAPTTGQVSVYGNAAVRGYQLAVDEYNEKGGVLGKQIELVVYDDKGDNNEAVNAYKKLVTSDKVDAIIGGVISTNTLAVAPLAAREGIPMISPTGTADDITKAGENIFRSCFTDPFQGEIVAEFAIEDLEAKKAAILFDQEGDYGRGLADSFEKTFSEAGGEIVAKKGFNPNDKDYKSILTEIKSTNPDVIFIPAYYNAVSLVGNQIKEVGIDATLLGGDGWDGVIEIDSAAVEGGYFANHYATDDPNPVVQNFIESYKAKYDGESPKSFAALGYDAAVTLFEAMEKAGTTDKEKVVEAIKATDLELVSGKTKFDEVGNPIKEVSIIQVVDGQYKLATKK